MESENQNTKTNNIGDDKCISVTKRQSDAHIETLKTSITEDNFNIEISNKGLVDLLLKNDSKISYKSRK